ncbi:ATP-binding protein [Patiriisocius marinus]|uniref:ATP-binding protein n=1 Tax=Patiriisocius marinus TaxID=1397112 RepID=UPI00124D41DC|nr:ATP-binding protein [Patiriisocius marinus]
MNSPNQNSEELLNNITLNTVPAYLDSILINFISNAIKYNSPKRNSFVKISVENNQENLVLKITANGLGIDLDKHREMLFAPKTTFHDKQDSRGIGLFITVNHVLSLGGSIKVESKLDEGTIFYIQFPKK